MASNPGLKDRLKSLEEGQVFTYQGKTYQKVGAGFKQLSDNTPRDQHATSSIPRNTDQADGRHVNKNRQEGYEWTSTRPNPKQRGKTVEDDGKQDEEDEDEDEDGAGNPDATEFAILKDTAEVFASIEQNDFEGRATYLAAHPNLLIGNFADFLGEAVKQILVHNPSAAIQCMQSLVILRLCTETRPKYLKDRVLEMQEPNSELNQEYKKLFREVCTVAENTAKKKAKEKAKEKGSKERYRDNPRSPTSVTANQEAQVPPATKHGRHDSKLDETSSAIQDLRNLHLGPIEIGDETEDPPDSEDTLQGLSTVDVVPVRTESDLKMIEPNQFSDEAMQTLSAEYKVPGNGRTFFEPGRVFSILWHESAGNRHGSTRNKPVNSEGDKSGPGDNYGPNITIGPYGEKIFSHIRRMISIRNRKGYCWCIAINSYGNQGLMKQGLDQKERQAHAIVHDAKRQALQLPGEPLTVKDHIAVDMEKGQTLSRASRLHYGKPYVVEWNTRIMKVGKVSRVSMPALLADARLELIGDSSSSSTRR